MTRRQTAWVEAGIGVGVTLLIVIIVWTIMK